MRQPISAWLCNDLLPGDQVAELALDPTDWDLSGIEDSGILEELHEVILCVSASNLQDKTKELQNKRKEPMPALEMFLEPAIDRIENEYAQADNVYREWKLVEDQNVMSTCLVVGMTTSCAASRQTILKNLKPSVVIVEEAAEVLEAHVVVSLTGDVEHLIMIGEYRKITSKP
ncbi:NFX1-type zinc finger-containing protein 1 homolog [Frankliniella occidentalis]|uniref:NFX1-type zinc finger-containing protein 1 homolog n=1 Tax=Frankliniella occidentalis TaxID=133901 RepID=A0A9C6XU92_FRAOC|nr:NFX1-type zinc finger-containing protein 1 homolog [Frankliniella occidentalis]